MLLNIGIKSTDEMHYRDSKLKGFCVNIAVMYARKC